MLEDILGFRTVTVQSQEDNYVLEESALLNMKLKVPEQQGGALMELRAKIYRNSLLNCVRCERQRVERVDSLCAECRNYLGETGMGEQEIVALLG